MSQVKKTHPTYLFVFIIGLLLLFSQAACSPNQQAAASNMLSNISNGVDAALVEADDLVFAGQIEDENGRWLNNYVVVLFKNGEEISRTSSRLLDSPLSSVGPMDGVFELKIFNEYKLNQQHGFYFPTDSPVEVKAVNGIVGTRYIGTWFDNLTPGSLRVIEVPEKQLVYSLVVLPNPLDELPESHHRGNVKLEGSRLVTNVTDDGEEAEDQATQVTVTAVPEPILVSQTNVQFTLLPSRNNGLDWHWQMTGYFGNRWDVWERFVAPRNPGMDWNTFEYAVLAHNPQLETDGFVFYPEKSYLLPLNH